MSAEWKQPTPEERRRAVDDAYAVASGELARSDQEGLRILDHALDMTNCDPRDADYRHLRKVAREFRRRLLIPIQAGQTLLVRFGVDEGHLWPGIFNRRRLVGEWDNPDMLARDAERVADTSFGSRLTVMCMVDWFTRPRPDALDGIPIPACVFPALAAALDIAGELARRDRDLEAERLRASGLRPPEIAAMLNTSIRNVQPSRTYRRPPTWSSADVVVTAAREAKVYERDKSRNAKLAVYDAVHWFAERSEPLEYAVWWATICALGLGHGLPGKSTRAGLTDLTVTALEGHAKPDAYHAAAKAVGEARAAFPRVTSFSGVEPLPLNRVATIAAKAAAHDDRRRRSEAANAEADERAQRRRADLSTEASNRVTVEEWAADRAFQRLASNYETIARFTRTRRSA